MANIKTNELAKEAVELIKEYGELSKVICDGDNLIESVRICEDGESIIVKELHSDEEDTYGLFKISSLLSSTMFYGGFDEACDLAINNCISDFDTFEKEEFINKIGSIHYTQVRTTNIYERLKEIEKEC